VSRGGAGGAAPAGEAAPPADRRAAALPLAEEVGDLEPAPPPAEATLDSLPPGSINRQVFILALPMLGEQVGNFLVGFVDTWLAGRVSKEATAAVGTASYMGWFVMLAVALVGTGAGALVARCFGARDTRTANRALHQSLMMALGVGVVMSALIYLAATPLAAWLGRTPEASRLLSQYLRVDCAGYTMFSLLLIGSAVVRAAGDTRTPMAIMIIVNVFNAFVSAALVFGWFGPRLGVLGIALGTVAARSLGGLLMLLVLAGGVRGLRLRRDLLCFDLPVTRRILRVGIPAAGDSGLMWVAQMAFISVVAFSGAGETATANYAAHMIAIRMEAISFLPAVAWMTAAATLVGQYLGAHMPARAAASGHRAALQCALLTGVIGVIFYLLAGPIYAFMSDDAAVRSAGVGPFRIMAFFQPILGVAIIYIGALRGAGDTRTTMLFSLIGGVLLRVPVAWLFGVHLSGGLLGCWIGMWCDNVFKFLAGGARFLHGGWSRIRV